MDKNYLSFFRLLKLLLPSNDNMPPDFAFLLLKNYMDNYLPIKVTLYTQQNSSKATNNLEL